MVHPYSPLLLTVAAQYFFSHPSVWRLPRWNPLPPVSGLEQLAERVDEAQRYATWVQCWLGRRKLYTIDLRYCSSLLRGLATTSDAMTSFNKSINGDKSQQDGDDNQWVHFFDPPTDTVDPNLRHISRMVYCNEMTAWHSFTTFVDWPNNHHRLLDPDSEEDAPLLQTATVLSRFISLRLESTGFEQLHKRLNGQGKLVTSELVQYLGQWLLSLRRRICIWEVGPEIIGKDDFIARATSVCRILYFHYFYALSNAALNPDFDGRSSKETVWNGLIGTPDTPLEDLPTIETQEGFEHWMRRGHVFLREYQQALHLDGLSKYTQ